MNAGFKKLIVWQKSIDLAVHIYRLTSEFPDHEKYGMKSQINRSSVSVACNIAEGAGRVSKKEFANFLSIARASGNELETLLIISARIGYINENTLKASQERITEIQRMLNALKTYISVNKTTPAPVLKTSKD
ncbi:MAG: four helix bundle protein [Flavobacteriales bacterium]